MPYTKTDWENEVPATSPVRYTLRDVNGDVLYDDVTIDLKTSVTAGTPLDSTNLNKIEQGLEDVFGLAENIATAQLLDGVLSADATGRAKMADGFITLLKLASDLRFQKLYEFEADGTSHLDWTSIPGSFRHLVMIYNGMSTRVSAGLDDFYLKVNGDTGVSYYTAKYLNAVSGAGNTPTWSNPGPHSLGLLSAILPSQNEGYLPTGSGLVLFPNYAGSTFYKSCISLSAFNTTYYDGFVIANCYRANIEPITRLTGSMAAEPEVYYPRAGSVFSLYGFN